MLVIIGGSGMLFEASQTLVEKSSETVLLCGRQESRYQPLLTNYPLAQFVTFDFSKESAYQSLAEQLQQQDEDLTFLVWVHSPYYVYLAQLLQSMVSKINKVYLVKGSNNVAFPVTSPPVTVIQLGKHVTENRWLTHHEISQKVLEIVLER